MMRSLLYHIKGIYSPNLIAKLRKEGENPADFYRYFPASINFTFSLFKRCEKPPYPQI